MMRDVIILGTGGNCVDIAEAVALRSDMRVIGYLDDDASRHGEEILGVKVLGALADAARFSDAYFVNGIGSPKSFRHKPSIIARTTMPLGRFATVVHPGAVVSASAELAAGVVVLGHATVCARAKVCEHSILLPQAVLSHDAILGAYGTMATAAVLSGNVTTGARCYLGARSGVREGVSIADDVLVGMGAVVLRDVAAGQTVVGCPARPRHG